MENRALDISEAINKRSSLLNHFEKILACELDDIARAQYKEYIFKKRNAFYQILDQTLDSNSKESQIFKSLNQFENEFYNDLLELHHQIEKSKKAQEERERIESHNQMVKVLEETQALSREVKPTEPSKETLSPKKDTKIHRAIIAEVGISIFRTYEIPIKRELNSPGKIALLYKGPVSANDVIEAFWLDKKGNLTTKTISVTDLLETIKPSDQKIALNQLQSQLNLLREEENTSLTKMIEEACQGELKNKRIGYLTKPLEDKPIDDAFAFINQMQGLAISNSEMLAARRNMIARISKTIHNAVSAKPSVLDAKINDVDINELDSNNEIILEERKKIKRKIEDYEEQIKLMTISEKNELLATLNQIKALDSLFDTNLPNAKYVEDINRLVDENYQAFFEAYKDQLPKAELTQSQPEETMFGYFIKKVSTVAFNPETPLERETRIKETNRRSIKNYINYTYAKIIEGKPGENGDHYALYISNEKIHNLSKLTIYHSLFGKRFEPISLSFFQSNIIQNKIDIERKRNPNYDLNQLIPLITKVCHLTPEAKCNYQDIKNRLILEKLGSLEDEIKQAKVEQSTNDDVIKMIKNNVEEIGKITAFLQQNKQTIEQKAEYYDRLRAVPELKAAMQSAKADKMIANNYSAIIKRIDGLENKNAKLGSKLLNQNINRTDVLEEARAIKKSLKKINEMSKNLLKLYDDGIKNYEKSCDEKIKELNADAEKFVAKLEGEEFSVKEIFKRNEHKIREIEEIYTNINNSKRLKELFHPKTVGITHESAQPAQMEKTDEPVIIDRNQQFEQKKIELENIKKQNIQLYEQITGKKESLSQGEGIQKTKLELYVAATQKNEKFEKLIELNKSIEALKTYREKYKTKEGKYSDKENSFQNYADKLRNKNDKDKNDILFKYLHKADSIQQKIDKLNGATKSTLKDEDHNKLFEKKFDIRLDDAVKELESSVTKLKKTEEDIYKYINADSISLKEFETIKSFFDNEIPVLEQKISQITTQQNNILQSKTVESINQSLDEIKAVEDLITKLSLPSAASKQAKEYDNDTYFDSIYARTKESIEKQLNKATEILNNNKSLPETEFKTLQAEEKRIVMIKQRTTEKSKEVHEEIKELKKSKLAEAEELVKKIESEEFALTQLFNNFAKEYRDYANLFVDKNNNHFTAAINNIQAKIKEVNDTISAIKDKPVDPFDILKLENAIKKHLPSIAYELLQLKIQVINLSQNKKIETMNVALKNAEVFIMPANARIQASNATLNEVKKALQNEEYLAFLAIEKMDFSKDIKNIDESKTTITNELLALSERLKSKDTSIPADEFHKLTTDIQIKITAIFNNTSAVIQNYNDSIKKYFAAKISEFELKIKSINTEIIKLDKEFELASETNPQHKTLFSQKNNGISFDAAKSNFTLKIKEINDKILIAKANSEDPLIGLQEIDVLNKAVLNDIPLLTNQIEKLSILNQNIIQTKELDSIYSSFKAHQFVTLKLFSDDEDNKGFIHFFWQNYKINLKNEVSTIDSRIKNIDQIYKDRKSILNRDEAIEPSEFTQFANNYKRSIDETNRDIASLTSKLDVATEAYKKELALNEEIRKQSTIVNGLISEKIKELNDLITVSNTFRAKYKMPEEIKYNFPSSMDTLTKVADFLSKVENEKNETNHTLLPGGLLTSKNFELVEMKFEMYNSSDRLKSLGKFQKKWDERLNITKSAIVATNLEFYLTFLMTPLINVADSRHKQLNDLISSFSLRSMQLEQLGQFGQKKLEVDLDKLEIDPTKLEKVLTVSGRTYAFNEHEKLYLTTPYNTIEKEIEDFKNLSQSEDERTYNNEKKELTDINGIPTDRTKDFETINQDLAIINKRLEILNKRLEILIDQQKNLPYSRELKREIIHHYLDTNDPLETEDPTIAPLPILNIEEGEYPEMIKNYQLLEKVNARLTTIAGPGNINFSHIRDIFRDEELKINEKLALTEQAILNKQWPLESKTNLFINDPIADGLREIINSPGYLNLPYKYGEVCRARVEVSRNPPDLKDIKRIQNDLFASRLKQLFRKNDWKGYSQYMMTSDYYFDRSDNFLHFNSNDDLGRKNRARARIVIEKDLMKREKKRAVDDHGELPPQMELTQEALEACQVLINPSQMDKDKSEFPFTCFYQRFLIEVSESHLKTQRGDIVIALKKVMEEIRNKPPADELSKALSMRDMIFQARKAIDHELAETIPGWFLSFFGQRRQSNLGDVLNRIYIDLQNVIEKIKPNQNAEPSVVAPIPIPQMDQHQIGQDLDIHPKIESEKESNEQIFPDPIPDPISEDDKTSLNDKNWEVIILNEAKILEEKIQKEKAEQQLEEERQERENKRLEKEKQEKEKKKLNSPASIARGSQWLGKDLYRNHKIGGSVNHTGPEQPPFNPKKHT